MPTEKKKQIVEELTKKIAECVIAISTDYRGLAAQELTEFRRSLREKGLEYRIVKNRLAYLAADAAGRPGVKAIVQGPTGLVFGYKDPVEPAKALEEYIRSRRLAMTINGAFLDGRSLSPDQVSFLAQLPPKEELMARLVGQMQAPIVRLVTVLQGPLRGLVTVLQRRIELGS